MFHKLSELWKNPDVRHRAAGGGIGMGITLLFVVIVVVPYTSQAIQQIELKSLDLRFSLGPGEIPSPRIVHIDIDDNSIKLLQEWPWPRRNHAYLVTGLTDLGVRVIVFDVEFPDRAKGESTFDDDGNLVEVIDNDAIFSDAVAGSRIVYIPYSFSQESPFDRKFAQYDVLFRRRLSENFLIPEEEFLREGGEMGRLLQGHMEGLRGRFANRYILDRLKDDPDVSFDTILSEFLPEYDPLRHRYQTKLIRAAYETTLAVRAIRDRFTIGLAPELPESTFRATVMTPPRYEYARALRGSGTVNIEHDIDGIVRRVPLYWVYQGILYPHLQLAVACDMLGVPLREVRIHPGKEIVLPEARMNPQDPPEDIRIPITERGEVLIAWAKPTAEGQRWPFEHIPFAKIVEFWQKGDLLESAYDAIESGLPQQSRRLDPLRKALRQEQRRDPDSEILPKIRADMQTRKETLEQVLRDAVAQQEAEVRKLGDLLASDRVGERMRADLEKGLLEAERKREQAQSQLSALEERKAERTELDRVLRPLEEGKICVVGSANTGSSDLKPTPLWEEYPGVGVHTNLLNSLIHGRAIARVPRPMNLLALILSGGVVTILCLWRGPVGAFLLTLASSALYGAFAYYLFTFRLLWLDTVAPYNTVFFVYASITAFRQLTEEKRKRQVKKIFEHYLSPSVVAEVLKNPEDLKLGGEKKEATVFFSDVAGFTTLSERMSPEDVVAYLNDYLDVATGIILRHEGYLDKYIGDGIMAVFGVPLPRADHPILACFASLEVQQALADLADRYMQEGRPMLRVRIGLASGEMVVGNVGSEAKVDYTVIGDVVNLAARLEGANKNYKSRLLIAESTFKGAKDFVRARELDLLAVKGKKKAVRVYELLCRKEDPLPFPEEALHLFEKGLEAYRAQEFLPAVELFGEVLEIVPADGPSLVYLGRCQEFIEFPPGPNWDGVYVAKQK